MTTFTNTLPAAAPYGTGPQYIAINLRDSQIKAPLSHLQLEARFGPHWANANNGDQWVWAELVPEMAKALLAGQPEQGATGDGEVERLRELLAEAIMYLRNIGDSASSSADCIGADLKRLEGKG